MSSEALERRASIHKLCVAWMTVPSLPDNAIPASPDDVLWLLAEVARLEQERDKFMEHKDAWATVAENAKHQRDNFERIAREQAERAHANWTRAEAAEAALAVAREREQRATKALGEDQSGRAFSELLAVAANMLEERGGGPVADCLAGKAADVDAALVDEPAAATLAEPGEGGVEGDVPQDRGSGATVQTSAENGAPGQEVGLAAPGSASAAVDEPGETPT